MRGTIKLKLTVVFTILILIIAGLATYSAFSLATLNAASSAMVDGPVRRLELALTVNVAALDAIRAQKNALIADSAADDEKYFSQSVEQIDILMQSTAMASPSHPQKASLTGRRSSTWLRPSRKKPRL